MPFNITTTNDISADVLQTSESRTRFANIGNIVPCGIGLPLTSSGGCSECYCHSVDRNSIIPKQYVIGAYDISDLERIYISVRDESNNEVLYLDTNDTLGSNLQHVGSNLTDDYGLRLSHNISLANLPLNVNCFTINAVFEITGQDDVVIFDEKYCIDKCDDLITISSEYPEGGFDCLGIYQDGTILNQVTFKGGFELQDFQLKDDLYNNENQRTFTKVRDVYRLVVVAPEHMALIIKNILTGTNLKVNGDSFSNESLFSKNNDINGYWIIEVDLFKECNPNLKNC